MKAPKNKVRLTVAALVAAFCFFLIVDEAYACSCGEFPKPAQAMEQSVKMFSGKVVAIHGGGATQRDPTLISGYILVEFEVYTVWKGPAFATMFVETAWWSGSCGVEFYVGEEWLVVSYDGTMTHPCNGTRRLSLAQAELDALDGGQVPAQGTIEPWRQAGEGIERIRPKSAAADAPAQETSSLTDALPAWLGFAVLIVVAVGVLGWVLHGTTRRR